MNTKELRIRVIYYIFTPTKKNVGNMVKAQAFGTFVLNEPNACV